MLQVLLFFTLLNIDGKNYERSRGGSSKFKCGKSFFIMLIDGEFILDS